MQRSTIGYFFGNFNTLCWTFAPILHCAMLIKMDTLNPFDENFVFNTFRVVESLLKILLSKCARIGSRFKLTPTLTLS